MEPTVEPGEIFASLPECEPDTGPSVDAPAGLPLPPGTHVSEVRPNGPLTEVIGSVGLNPIALREHYEGRDDIEVLGSEDEVVEAELLFRWEDQRVYLRAQATCRTRSFIALIMAPESAAESVPTPMGGAGAS